MRSLLERFGRRGWRTVGVVGVVGGLTAALAAVFLLGDGGSPPPTITTAAPTTTTAPPPFPLTGLPDPEHRGERLPALAVKIDGSDGARPQAGLEDADVVFEEIVEGGVTRFVAVFHSTAPGEVGPVRSIRPVDPNILAPLKALFAFSGGIREFRDALGPTGVQPVHHDAVPGAYTRRPDRRGPLDLFVDAEALWAQAERAEPPIRLLPYLGDGEAFAGDEVAAVEIVYSSSTRVEYAYDRATRRWGRILNGTIHETVGGRQIAPRNLVVQRVEDRPTEYVDQAGARVTESIVTGRGEAWFFVQGRMRHGQWRRDRVEDVTTYTDDAGNVVRFAPGTTWIHLLTAAGSLTETPTTVTGPG